MPATILLAFNYPLVLLAFLLVFVIAVAWLAPKLFRGIHFFITRLRGGDSRGSG